jgi:hypothetical protein
MKDELWILDTEETFYNIDLPFEKCDHFFLFECGNFDQHFFRQEVADIG